MLSGGFAGCESDEVPLSFTEYSLEETGYWDLDADDNGRNVVLINSDEELKKYFVDIDNMDYPPIDFSKHTLLLAGGQTQRGISEIKISSFRQLSDKKYKLDINIFLNFTAVAPEWVVAILTGKLNDDSKIEVNVTMTN